MAIMYLSKEKFTCLKEQTAYTFLCLNNLLFPNSIKPDLNSLVNSVDPDQLASSEDATCELVIIK